MARYSIDGQFLTNMADMARERNDESDKIQTGTFTCVGASNYNISYTVSSNQRYKLTLTINEDPTTISNIHLGSKTTQYFDSCDFTMPSTGENVVVHYFTALRAITAVTIYIERGGLDTTGTYTIEPTDADNNPLYRYTPEEALDVIVNANSSAAALKGLIDGTTTTNITLPEGLTTIRSYAFYECEGLTVNEPWPDTIQSIGGSAFAYCENVVVPEKLPTSLTSLGNECFGQCSAHSRLIIPAGVKSVGRKIFYSLWGTTSDLTEVIFLGTPTSIGTSSSSSNQAFYNCSAITSIKVPWSEGAVANAPWGATNATITYDYVHEEG